MNKPLGELPLSVDDVFHRPWCWTRISRVEALASDLQPVVVVSTAGAMWFTRDSPFCRGVGASDLRSLSYYRCVAVAERDHVAGGGPIRYGRRFGIIVPSATGEGCRCGGYRRAVCTVTTAVQKPELLAKPWSLIPRSSLPFDLAWKVPLAPTSKMISFPPIRPINDQHGS